MKTAFLTSCNEAFFEGAIALLRGVRRFHPDVKRYCITPREEVDLGRRAMGDLAHVIPPPRDILGIPENLQMAAARVFAPMLEADTVLYVDSDACLVRPAPELWTVKRNRILAAPDAANRVLDNVPADLRERFVSAHPVIGDRKGFNSGVLALNTADWQDLPERFERAVTQAAYPYYPPILDQPILNGLLLDSVDWLPQRYNIHVLSQSRITKDAVIVHFTGKDKPWMSSFPRHEPAYQVWLEHGLEESRAARLLLSKVYIGLNTPRRHIMRRLRQVYRGGSSPRA